MFIAHEGAEQKITRTEIVLPTIFMGGTIYIIYKVGNEGQAVPQDFFSTSSPEPPIHLAHTLGGSCLNSPWPTGTHVLKVKE